MGNFMKRTLSVAIVLTLILSLFTFNASAAPASSKYYTTPTGYDSAADVQYKIYTQSGKQVIANWGARGEDCVFLTTYATNFYTGSYTFDLLTEESGGTTQSNASSSDLFRTLKQLMSSKHTFYTYYDGSKNVRDFYQYTDCVSSNTAEVSLLYRCYSETSTWNKGELWNQEHVWPQSKLNSSQQIGDIMHLRPSNPSENSSRGNSAYGEGGSCYDPGPSTRGDCARMVLYMYVRWNVTGTMWGSSGVMENMNTLLKWMQEDPVDTWEMGRNDAVQSITGTRNVFVDYPELAWLLFGKEVPTNMTTPSGAAKSGTVGGGNTGSGNTGSGNTGSGNTGSGNTGSGNTGSGNTGSGNTGSGNTGSGNTGTTTCQHTSTEVRNAKAATCQTTGYTGDTYCKTCGVKTKTGSSLPLTGHSGELRNVKAATCTADGYTGDTYCKTCGEPMATGEVIPATGHTETVTGKLSPNCTKDGYSGDTICSSCNTTLTEGTIVPATGVHRYGIWQVTKAPTEFAAGTQERYCSGCGHAETLELAPTVMPLGLLIGMIAGGVVILAGATVTVIVVIKKKKVSK